MGYTKQWTISKRKTPAIKQAITLHNQTISEIFSEIYLQGFEQILQVNGTPDVGQLKCADTK